MSQEELPSVPTVDTLSIGERNERPAPVIEFVPISIVQKMEYENNQLETFYRQATRKIQDYISATAIAEQIIESLRSNQDNCSDMGRGPLLGLISSFNQALIKARTS